MNARELLVKAKAHISDKNRWCQGNNAVDTVGQHVNPWHQDAVRWCTLGALFGALRDDSDKAAGVISEARAYLNCAAMEVSGDDGMSLTMYNDQHSHAEVLGMYDHAIKLVDDPKYDPYSRIAHRKWRTVAVSV